MQPDSFRKWNMKVQATDAKEVELEKPAEETSGCLNRYKPESSQSVWQPRKAKRAE